MRLINHQRRDRRGTQVSTGKKPPFHEQGPMRSFEVTLQGGRRRGIQHRGEQVVLKSVVCQEFTASVHNIVTNYVPDVIQMQTCSAEHWHCWSNHHLDGTLLKPGSCASIMKAPLHHQWSTTPFFREGRKFLTTVQNLQRSPATVISPDSGLHHQSVSKISSFDVI